MYAYQELSELEIHKENHIYKQGSSFEKVMMLYRFDKKLRKKTC